MKNIFLSLLALVTLTMVACGPNKVVEAQKTILTESISGIDSIKTMDDFQVFQQDFAAKQQTFLTENADALKDIEADAEQTKAISDLQTQWVAKMQDKAQELIAAQMAAQTDSIATAQQDSILINGKKVKARYIKAL